MKNFWGHTGKRQRSWARCFDRFDISIGISMLVLGRSCEEKRGIHGSILLIKRWTANTLLCLLMYVYVYSTYSSGRPTQSKETYC